MKRTLILAAVATAVAGQVQARDYISIVGSSTVYPFLIPLESKQYLG